MANNKSHTRILGTEIKLNIHIDPINDLHMSEYDFECKFFVFAKKSVTIKKEDMVQVDEDNYIAIIDTLPIGVGRLHLTLTAYIPDNDFPDKPRKEVSCVDTGIEIINC